MTVYIKDNKEFLDFPKSGSGGSQPSGDYYTKSEIDEKFSEEDRKILEAKQEAIDLIPTKVSQLDNDSNFADRNYVGQEIGKIQVPTKVTDLQDANDYATKTFVGEEMAKISIPTKTSQLQNDSGFATEGFVRSEVGKIVLPTKVSDLQNDSGFITSSALNGYATQTYVDNAIAQSLGEIETILRGI